MMFSGAVVSALLAVVAAEPRNFTTIQPTGTFNPMAATAVHTVYPAQHHNVKGRLVDHMWHIVLDAADYEDVEADETFQELAKKGITLTNYYAVGHPVQANYLAMAGGDTFGLVDEGFVALPSNVSTLVESLEARHVLWAQYTEGQPFTAYPGWEYESPDSEGGVDYSRSRNPFIQFDSVAKENHRLVNLRSLKTFYNDYNSGHFPQWMMIRPNLYHDGTKSDIATAGRWVRDFLEPYINFRRHLFIVTFASAKSEDRANRVFTLILGDMHDNERNSKDDMYYDHYSILSSTQANYDLPSLGRYDCTANVFSIVNRKANLKQTQRTVPENYNNGRAAGWLSDTQNPLPLPNLTCRGAGREGVLRRVKKIWKKVSYSYYQWTFQY